jgi:hypothetical protein
MYSLSLSFLEDSFIQATATWKVTRKETGSRFCFHARHLSIQSISIQGKACTFTQVDFLRQVTRDTSACLQDVSARWVEDTLYASEKGEVIVHLPCSESKQFVLTIRYTLPYDRTKNGSVLLFPPSLDAEGFGARCLFPCLESTCFSFLRVSMETKRGIHACATGTLVDTKHTDTTSVYTFEYSSSIHPSCIGFTLGRYRTLEHPALAALSCHVWLPEHVQLSVDDSLLTDLVNLVSHVRGSVPSSPFTFIYTDENIETRPLVPFSSFCVLPLASPHATFSELVESRFYPTLGYTWHLYGSRFAGGRIQEPWILVGICMYMAYLAVEHACGTLYASALLTEWMKDSTPVRSLTSPNLHLSPVGRRIWTLHTFSWKHDSWTYRAAWMMYRLGVSSGSVLAEMIREVLVLPGSITEAAFLTVLKARTLSRLPEVDGVFIEQWIHSAFHTPVFTGTVSYDDKTRVLNLAFSQSASTLYRGKIKIRVVEMTGVYEYEKEMDSETHQWTIVCQTPQKKGKGGRRTRVVEERTEQWNQVGALRADQLLSLASKHHLRKFWKIEGPVRYIIVDPEHMWMAKWKWIQPREYWMEILNEPCLYADIRLQLLAIESLSECVFISPTEKREARRDIILSIASYLAGVATEEARNERVRVAAIQAILTLHQLVNKGCSVSTGTTMIQFLLMQVYRALYMDKLNHLPLSTRISERVIRQTLMEAIASLTHGGQVTDEVQEWMMGVLEVADIPSSATIEMGKEPSAWIRAQLGCAAAKLLIHLNEVESYTDTLPVANVIREIRLALDLDLLSKDEYRTAENDVTYSCLKSFAELEAQGILEPGTIEYRFYLRPTVWHARPSVRVEAFGCIVRLYVFKREQDTRILDVNVVEACLRIVAQEPSQWVQTRMMDALTRAFADIQPSIGPLLETTAIPTLLWNVLNAGSAYAPTVRLAVYRCWEQIWGMKQVPAVLQRTPTKVHTRSVFHTWMEEEGGSRKRSSSSSSDTSSSSSTTSPHRVKQLCLSD